MSLAVRLTLFAASVVISFMIAGCVRIPVTHKSTIDVKKDTLASLVGEDERTVVEKIGSKPMYRINDRFNTYLVYEGHYVEDLLHVGLVPWPIPMPVPLDKARGRDCLLLEFDGGEFTRFEFDSRDYPAVVDCRETFWGEEKFRELEFKQACLAANQSNAEAQYRMGDYYRTGFRLLNKNPVRAFLWYSLAQANGFEAERNRNIRTATGWKCCFSETPFEMVAEEMIPDQLAEAERLVAEWKPNPAECEVTVTLIGK
jgi:hypothetical protein